MTDEPRNTTPSTIDDPCPNCMDSSCRGCVPGYSGSLAHEAAALNLDRWLERHPEVS